MRGRVLVAVLAMLQLQGAAAQQAAPSASPATAKAVWKVDWTNDRCVLTRIAGDADQAGFAVRLFPGATRPELLVFVNRAATKLEVTKAGKATLELQPTGFKSEIDVAPEPVSNAQALILAFGGVDSRFLENFSKAEQLSFSIRGETVSVPMKNAGKAMEALQKCVDDTMAELGFDPKQMATLRDKPQGEWQKLATVTNYPQAALRARKSGVVVFRAVVDPAGRVSKCSVVQSSGTKELDDQTCTLLTSKVHFKPAVAADGSKVTAPIVDAMMWQPMMRGRR